MAGRFDAFAAERQAVLDFCRDLTPAEWATDSAAAGWRVRDVVAHLGATCHSLFQPLLTVRLMRSTQLERENDRAVDLRRDWPVERVLAEFENWSSRWARAVRLSSAGPLGSIRLPIGDLGRYPTRLLPSMLTFDWHTHLRHDIAPAVGHPAPPTDAARMAAVVEWMLAGLEQMNQDTMAWLEAPLTLTLTGPGGGTWLVTPAGAGRLTVQPAARPSSVAHITGPADGFPAWATTREKWRDHNLTVTGDELTASRFLDSINIV